MKDSPEIKAIRERVAKTRKHINLSADSLIYEFRMRLLESEDYSNDEKIGFVKGVESMRDVMIKSIT